MHKRRFRQISKYMGANHTVENKCTLWGALVDAIPENLTTLKYHIVESLSALPSCLQKFLQFPRFFTHPGTVFGVEHEFTGTPA